MKKTILIFLSVLLSLAMILPGATAVLAEPEKEAKPQQAVRAALMIRAPDTAQVGQPVTITVFGKFSHQPVAGAEVYALKADRTGGTTDNVTKNYSAAAVNYAALVNAEGIFLGETNKEGKVTGKFPDDGRYILIAFKAGHFPGFAWISITLSNIKGLHLRSPGSAEVGKPATFAVVERSSHEPVAEAAVYGKKIGIIGLPKPITRPAIASFFDNIIGIFRAKPAPPPVEVKDNEDETVKIAEETQDAEELEKNGIFLGYTNEKGELVYTFNEPGHFALAAVKKGYAPGFARINITLADQKALGIKSPDRADVNQPVTMTVFERRTSQVVPRASVYALRMGDLFTATPAEKPTTTILTPQPPIVAPEVSVDAETVKAKGIFLGETDDKGQLVHSFDKAGRYVLAAIKEGYQPGFARINIGTVSQKALGIKAPDRAEVGKQVTMFVFERNNSQPVPKAAVYALRLGDVITPLPAEPTTKVEPTIIAEVENAEVVKSKGLLIGYTDDKGTLIHSFDKTGRYVLAAIKDEYQPGFARINILLAAQKAIGIKVPDRAEVGKPINIVTFDRNNYQPVPKAAVYALRVGDPDGPVPMPFEAMLKAEAASPAEAEKHAADVKIKGIFLGYTNENAHLVYAFEKPGHYLLVAVKDGYLPGFARTTIVPRIIVPRSTTSNSPK